METNLHRVFRIIREAATTQDTRDGKPQAHALRATVELAYLIEKQKEKP